MRPVPHRLLAALLLALVPLAGCLGSAPAATDADGSAPPAVVEGSNATGLLASPGLVAALTCEQFHTLYPTPGASFQQFVPEGFSLAYENEAAGTINLGVFFSLCSGGAMVSTPAGALAAPEASEMWVLVPVVPPEAYAVPDVAGTWVPIEAYFTDTGMLQQYTAWGFDAIARSASLTSAPAQEAGPARVESVEVTSESGTYTLRSTIRLDPGEWMNTTHVLWTTRDGIATGRAILTTVGGENVGLGSGALAYAGSGGAPPATPGIVHRVGKVDTVVWHEGFA